MPMQSSEWPSDFDISEYSQGRFESVLMNPRVIGGSVTVRHDGKNYKFRRFKNLPSNELINLVKEGDILLCYTNSLTVEPGRLYAVKQSDWDEGIYVTRLGVDERPIGYNGLLGEPGTDGFRGAFAPIFVPIGTKVFSFKDEKFRDAFV